MRYRSDRPAAGPGTLPAAAALSLALHAALVWGPATVPGTLPRPGFTPYLSARLTGPARPADPLPGPAPATAAPPAANDAARGDASAENPPRAGREEAADGPESALVPVSLPAGAREPQAPRYYLPPELDERPRLLSPVEPSYPRSAGIAEGAVRAQLNLSESGEVEEVIIVRASPPGLFEEATRAAFGRARFSPGILAGKAVRSRVTVEIAFTPPAEGPARR